MNQPTVRHDPRQAAIDYLLARYEWHCEREQMVFATDEELADRHHRAALQVLWSMDAEQQDPLPPGLGLRFSPSGDLEP